MIVDNGFVVEGDGGDRFRDSEDDVEIFHRQQLRLPHFQPTSARQPLALGAMAIAARAVLHVIVLTVVAPFDNTAQRGRAAGFDGAHQGFLMPGANGALAGRPGRAVERCRPTPAMAGAWPVQRRLRCLVCVCGAAPIRSSGLIVLAMALGETAA